MAKKDAQREYGYLVATKGRPTKFKKEFTAELIKFFDTEPTRKEIMETVTEFNAAGEPKKTAEKWKHVPNKFPTLIQFAKHVKVSYFSLKEWAERGEDPEIAYKLRHNEGLSTKEVEMLKDIAEFSKAYKEAKDLQQDFLVQNGLNGASPAAAFIFTAKNVTKMRDKVENDINVRQVKPLLDNLKINVHDNDSDEEDGGAQ